MNKYIEIVGNNTFSFDVWGYEKYFKGKKTQKKRGLLNIEIPLLEFPHLFNPSLIIITFLPLG